MTYIMKINDISLDNGILERCVGNVVIDPFSDSYGLTLISNFIHICLMLQI